MARRGIVLSMAVLQVLVLAACSQPPTLRITQPRDGATVEDPVAVSVAVTGFKLQVAAPAENGVGHLHVIVDEPCIAAGQGIPVDDDHIHLWHGESVTQLDLPPGRHTICVQAGDGEHTALDVSDRVTVTVAGASS
jgi:hypothetical protein